MFECLDCGVEMRHLPSERCPACGGMNLIETDIGDKDDEEDMEELEDEGGYSEKDEEE